MRTLILGVSGLLGSNVAVATHNREIDVVGTYYRTQPSLSIDCLQCDITDSIELQQLINRCDPDTIINCAAMTDVDKCEQNPEEARAVNADAPEEIAQICSRKNIKLIHISTDYVFRGDRTEAYGVNDSPDPIQEYGKTKYAGEKIIRDLLPSAIIIRVSFLYGIHQSTTELTGFPAWIINNLQNRESVSLFTDQFVTPSRAGQAAKILLDLNADNHTGIFHIACRDCVTPYQFGENIAKRLGKRDLISKSTQEDVHRPATRPDYTCLDVRHTEQCLNQPQPTLTDELSKLHLHQI